MSIIPVIHIRIKGFGIGDYLLYRNLRLGTTIVGQINHIDRHTTWVNVAGYVVQSPDDPDQIGKWKSWGLYLDNEEQIEIPMVEQIALYESIVEGLFANAEAKKRPKGKTKRVVDYLQVHRFLESRLKLELSTTQGIVEENFPDLSSKMAQKHYEEWLNNRGKHNKKLGG